MYSHRKRLQLVPHRTVSEDDVGFWFFLIKKQSPRSAVRDQLPAMDSPLPVFIGHWALVKRQPPSVKRPPVAGSHPPTGPPPFVVPCSGQCALRGGLKREGGPDSASAFLIPKNEVKCRLILNLVQLNRETEMRPPKVQATPD